MPLRKLIARQLRLAVPILLLTIPAVAQVGGDFELRRVSVSAGGIRAEQGDQSASVLSGQPEPGRSSGGSYELNSGFYAPESSDRVFADSFE